MKKESSKIKDFSGYKVFFLCSSCKKLNGKIVERTIRKAFPDDTDSTLYVVKLKGVRAYVELYENEMYN